MGATRSIIPAEEAARRAREIYERDIKPRVEPEHIGEYVAVNIETGEYELGGDDIAVMKRAAAKYPPELLFGLRAGFDTMGRIGTQAPRGAV